jgi:uncharacterized protein (DUF362 family)
MKKIEYKKCDVSITQNDNEFDAIKEGLVLIKADKLIAEDDIVLLVPNFVNKDKPNPSSGVTVGPDTLRLIIKWIKNLNPKRIIVGSGSGGGDTLDVMKALGYDLVIKEENVEFIDFNKGPYFNININHSKPNRLNVNQILNEMTVLISFTQLKIHEEAVMSASIKNVTMSIPSTEEHGTPKKDAGIHDDLHGFISAMAEVIPIDISIVSANPVMIGTGPTKGISKHTGFVICGNNPISVDTVCARLLGFRTQAINYLYRLENMNIKETDINKIDIKGISIDKAEKIFSKIIYNEEISVDSK